MICYAFVWNNSFLILNNYRVPRNYLLNRSGNVTTDGQYVTSYKVCYYY